MKNHTKLSSHDTNLQLQLLYMGLLLFGLIVDNLLFQVLHISVLFAGIQMQCTVPIQHAIPDLVQGIVNELQLPEATRILTWTIKSWKVL